MQDDSDSMSRDSSNSDGQLQAAQANQKKKKGSKLGVSEVKGRFTCGCFKVFTSYRALYIHILHRHGGEFPKFTKIVCNKHMTSIDRYQDDNGEQTTIVKFVSSAKQKHRIEGTLLGLLEADIELFLNKLRINTEYKVSCLNQAEPITLNYLIENFPVRAFQNESEYSQLLRSLQLIQKQEEAMLRFSGFFFERSHRAFIPEGVAAIDKLTVPRVLAYFLISIASYVGLQHCRLIDEVVILAALFRKQTQKRGLSLDNSEQRWITNQTPGLPVEYTGEKNSTLSISPGFLDHFLEEFYPNLFVDKNR